MKAIDVTPFLTQNLSESIKRLRKQAGLTQQQLAEQTRCTRQEVSRVENGSFRGGFHKIERICERLGCAVTLRPQLEPGQAGSSEPIRILAIDDEPAVLWGYQQTFVPDQSAGINTLASLVQEIEEEQTVPLFSIATSTSGQEGVELLRQAKSSGSPFHLLILDMRMPGRWDGLRTATRAREIDPGIKIILISAYRDYSLLKMREVLGEGFVFQPKPYNQEDLIQLGSYLVAH